MTASEGLPLASNKAEALRREFDRTFARPPPAAVATRDYLAIRLGGDPHLLRMAQVCALLPLRSVTRLPGTVPALLGITGFRRALVPLYDLRALLGYPTGAPLRWFVIAAEASVGLAFESFEGHLRAAREPVGRAAGEGAARPHAGEVLGGSDGTLQSVLSVASVVEAIRGGAAQVRAIKER